MSFVDMDNERNGGIPRIEELLACLMAGVSDFVFIHSVAGRVKEANLAAVRSLGYSEDELKSADMAKIIDVPFELRQAWENLSEGRPFTAEGIVRHKDGGSLSALFSFFSLTKGPEPRILTIAKLILEQRETESAPATGQKRDPVTGFFSKEFFEEELTRLELERQYPLSVISGELNGLRMANDTYGPSAGDSLLKSAARILRKTCRKNDLIFRWKGGRFVVLLPRTKEEDAASLAFRIEDAYAKINIKDFPAASTLSLGYGTKHHRWQDFSLVLQDAEEDMNEQKAVVSPKTREAILGSILTTLAKDTPETKDHSNSVRKICSVLGFLLSLDEAELKRLDTAALLHDIGKIVIPKDLLWKREPLTEEEWETIKGHSEAGARIATSATLEAAGVSDVIRGHHEWWDGSGYPDGLAGDRIPLLSRIISLADAFDVMTRGTPYQPCMNEAEVLREIEIGSGRQFDPKIAALIVGHRDKLI